MILSVRMGVRDKERGKGDWGRGNDSTERGGEGGGVGSIGSGCVFF